MEDSLLICRNLVSLDLDDFTCPNFASPGDACLIRPNFTSPETSSRPHFASLEDSSLNSYWRQFPPLICHTGAAGRPFLICPNFVSPEDFDLDSVSPEYAAHPKVASIEDLKSYHEKLLT